MTNDELSLRIGRRVLKITNPGKVLFPDDGVTKQELVTYYGRIASWMLPHVRGRPLTLVRCEHGASKADALRSECSFLRHTSGWHRFVPDFVAQGGCPRGDGYGVR